MATVSGCFGFGLEGGSASEVNLGVGLSHDVTDKGERPAEFDERDSPDDRPPEFK